MILLLEYLCSLEIQHLATHVLIFKVKEFKQKMDTMNEQMGNRIRETETIKNQTPMIEKYNI